MNKSINVTEDLEAEKILVNSFMINHHLLTIIIIAWGASSCS